MKRVGSFGVILLLAAAAARAAAPTGDLLEGVAPGPDGMIDVLTVFPHQDDESSAGGTLLGIKDDPRVRIHLACLTLGDRSDARFFLGIKGEYLGRIRSGELVSAAAVYEAKEVIQLDYHDQGLKAADREDLINKIAGIIARTGAEVVITFDPSGLTRHPDHVTCSAAATQAFSRSGAHRLYYVTQPWWLFLQTSTITPFHEKAPHVPPTFKVKIRKQLTLKRLAFYEHASQKHFSLVGVIMEKDLLIPYEWFALAVEK
jgi:LmbE family N-acetylglucosaminyl deacetylase